MRIGVHVTNGIDMHEEGHRVDDDEHDRSQRVDAKRPEDVDIAGLDPAQHLDAHGFLGTERHLEEDDPGENRNHGHQAAGDEFRGLGADLATEQARDQEADQRKEDDKLVDHDPISPSSH
ncbi:hypothetical protein D3C80_1064790 [compost metagenome]